MNLKPELFSVGEVKPEEVCLDASEVQKYNGCGHPDQFELLIFSEAGKPVYSYTKREDAVTLMPLCSALIEYARKTQKETLQSIRTHNNLVIKFKTRSPLVIIVIHEAHAYVDALLLVEQVEAQLVSILTAKTLSSVFRDRPTFDLKRLLYGSEKLIDATTNLCAFPQANELETGQPGVEAFLALSGSSQLVAGSSSANSIASTNPSLPPRPHRIMIPIVIMPHSMRDSLHHILQNVIPSNSKNMVFSLLFKVESSKSSRVSNEISDLTSLQGTGGPLASASVEHDRDRDREQDQGEGQDQDQEQANSDDAMSFKLITVCNHHDRHKIKTADIHIILALLKGSRAQLASVESLWLPICLPKFNEDAFVHSYIAYMNGGRHCIAMMSIDRDEFTACQKSKNAIEEKLDSVMADSGQTSKYLYRISPLVPPVLLELQDKLVCGTLTDNQAVEVENQIKALNLKQDLYHARQLQFLWYQTSKHVLWWQRSSRKSPSPILYYVTKKMLQSSLKHLWLKLSDDSIFIGWHVPTFQLYTQFDRTITTNEAAEVIQRITNWIKKEEDSFSIKDYR